MTLRLVEKHKTCPACGLWKPWSEFYPASKWEDGTTRAPQTYCKPCGNTIRTEAHRAMKGAALEASRGKRRARAAKMTPEQRERKREVGRLSAAKRRRERAQVASEYKPRPRRLVAGEQNVWLPIAPLRERIAAETARIGQAAFAELVGVPERTVFRWLYEGEKIELSFADRVALAIEGPWLLNELYPLEIAA